MMEGRHGYEMRAGGGGKKVGGERESLREEGMIVGCVGGACKGEGARTEFLSQINVVLIALEILRESRKGVESETGV